MPENKNESVKWDAQLRKGTLELAVLAALQKRAMYGLEMLNYFHLFDTMQITEGTLYPLLDRLKRERLLAASWQQEGEQRPRKYYSLTKEGHQKLNELKARWLRSVEDLQQLLNSPTIEEGHHYE